MAIINRAYVQDLGRCWGPIFFPGENYAFYINLNAPTSDPDFGNFRLDLRRVGDTVAIAENIGLLNQDFVEGGVFYNIRAEFVFPEVEFGFTNLLFGIQ